MKLLSGYKSKNKILKICCNIDKVLYMYISNKPGSIFKLLPKLIEYKHFIAAQKG